MDIINDPKDKENVETFYEKKTAKSKSKRV